MECAGSRDHGHIGKKVGKKSQEKGWIARLFARGDGSGPRGVVAVAGAGGQFAVTVRRNDVNVNGAEAAVLGSVRRIVGQRVLMANVVGDLFTDGVDVLDIFRKISDAAGGLRN